MKLCANLTLFLKFLLSARECEISFPFAWALCLSALFCAVVEIIFLCLPWTFHTKNKFEWRFMWSWAASPSQWMEFRTFPISDFLLLLLCVDIKEVSRRFFFVCRNEEERKKKLFLDRHVGVWQRSTERSSSSLTASEWLLTVWLKAEFNNTSHDMTRECSARAREIQAHTEKY